MGCEGCAYFVPHAIYPYVGYCTEKGSVVISREGCERYTRRSVEELKGRIIESGWVYCITCRSPVYSLENLEEHFARGHAVAASVLEDQVALEESHSAD